MKKKSVSVIFCMLVLTTAIPLSVSAIDVQSTMTSSQRDDVVIELLEQMDESLILGYLEELVSFGPRVTGTSACQASAANIFNEFQSMGLEVRYHNWSSSGYTASNVEATLYGTDESSDEIYLVCGHYDTVSGAPGADDDGSGVVAAMGAAALMSQYVFNHTVRFVTFSGEEQGLLGSAEYVQDAVANGDNIAGTLNADMIGNALNTADGNRLKIFEDDQSEWLYTFTAAVNTEYSSYINLNVIHSGETWGSDHNSFWDGGYPALFYHEYDFSDVYHSPQDTIANMNITYNTKNAKLIMATLAELAEPGALSNPPAAPTVNGPTQGVIDEDYTYTMVTTDPDGDDVYYYIDWGDGSHDGWIGPYSSGQTISITHHWASPGNYTVRVKAKDINSATSEWSALLIVTIFIDRPPTTPTVTGPAQGKSGISYLYKFQTTDPDGDMVYYFVDWGDNTTTENWVGPYNSGHQVGIRHTWSVDGSYTISVKAKDAFGIESDWGTLEVTMPLAVRSQQSQSVEISQNSQTSLSLQNTMVKVR